MKTELKKDGYRRYILTVPHNTKIEVRDPFGGIRWPTILTVGKNGKLSMESSTPPAKKIPSISHAFEILIAALLKRAI